MGQAGGSGQEGGEAVLRFCKVMALLTVVILLLGCGATDSPTSPPPTAVVAEVTDTPLPPTAEPTLTRTTLPPTPTPLPPTSTPSPQPSATPTRTPEPSPTPVEASLLLPTFVPGECRFHSSAATAECGDLIVLEDREKPDGATVSLHVAIFRSYSPNPEPDPVIYLMGGGGGNALGAADYYLRTVGNKIRAARDFIMYNQRGTHLNEPFLGCPGEADPVENQAVVSDVPALIFAGRFDPITTPEWGQLAAETLSHSYCFEFPNMGHGVMRADPCALRIGLQFLDDPLNKPDASCLAELTLPTFR